MTKTALKVAAALVAVMRVIQEIIKIIGPHIHNLSSSDLTSIECLKQDAIALREDALSASYKGLTKQQATILEQRLTKIRLSSERWHHIAKTVASSYRKHRPQKAAHAAGVAAR